jgi:hypothetical protein
MTPQEQRELVQPPDSYDGETVSMEARSCRRAAYFLDWGSTVQAMEESGAFVMSEMDKLKTDEDQSTFQLLVDTIANFFLDLIEGASKIVAERGMDNNAAEEIPPVLPLELCAMSTNDFAELLAKQQTRISHTLTSQKEIEMIEEQFRNLKLAYREEAGIKAALDACQGVQSMRERWRPIDGAYNLLRTFCGGIATVMENPFVKVICGIL